MFALEVNGEMIPREIVDHELDQLRDANEDNPSPLSEEELQKEIERDLAARIILRQEAVQREYQIEDATISEALEQLYDDHGGKDSFYEAYGFEESHHEQIREDLKINLSVDRLLNDLSTEVPIPNAIDIKNYYQVHEESFVDNEGKALKFEDVSELIRDQLIYDQKNEKIGQWVDEQLKKASISRLSE